MLCIKFLQLGADLYLRDEREGKTALDYAESTGSREARDVLREAAAARAAGRMLPDWPWLAPSSAPAQALERGRLRVGTAGSSASSRLLG